MALKSVYMFDTDESIWRRLPDLPAPTSGAGIAFDQQKIHILGGFDIILNRSVVHGEVRCRCTSVVIDQDSNLY